jgi:tetratricopeptide (TPR) repeat protein
MFRQGYFEAARKLFEKAIGANDDDSDRSRQSRSDNLMIWAASEQRFGFSEEAKKRLDQALEEAFKIDNKRLKERIIEEVSNRREVILGDTRIASH